MQNRESNRNKNQHCVQILIHLNKKKLKFQTLDASCVLVQKTFSTFRPRLSKFQRIRPANGCSVPIDGSWSHGRGLLSAMRIQPENGQFLFLRVIHHFIAWFRSLATNPRRLLPMWIIVFPVCRVFIVHLALLRLGNWKLPPFSPLNYV